MIPVDRLGLALFHFFWQGALLALIAGIFLQASRQPRIRYLIGVAFLLCMPLAIALTLTAGNGVFAPGPAALVPAPSSSETVDSKRSDVSGEAGIRGKAGLPTAEFRAGAAASGAAGGGLQGLLSPLVRHSRLIVTVWLAGVLLMSLRLMRGSRLANRLIHETALPAVGWHTTVDALRERLGLTRAVRVLESAAAATPYVVGWLRPVILLPASVVSGLSPRQIEILIAHELAHVSRHDYAVNLFQSAVEALLFYHPAVWWLSRRIREERELCCDDLAIQVTGNAREYAETLYALERQRAPAPVLAVGAGGGSLLRRVRRLVEPASRRNETFSRSAAGLVVILLVATAGVSGPLSRLFAQPPAVGDGDRSPVGANTQASNQAPESTARPENFITAPDLSRPLSERVGWTRAEAERRGDGRFWVVYTIRPLDWSGGAIYVGQDVTLLTGNGDVMTITGLINVGDPSQLKIDGTPLLGLLGGRPDDAAVILGFRRGDTAPERLTIASLSLEHDFLDLPIYWLGAAPDDQSLALAEDFFDGARGAEQKKRYVCLMGIHESSDLVVPKLVSLVEGREPTPVRTEAVEWLGRHPRMEALRALDRAARNDNSSEVQREAAESVGDLRLPEAFDVLRRLALELDSPDARREAVESIGQRPEPQAARVLQEIAVEDRNADVRREAVESLGDLSDGRGWATLLDLVENSPSDDVRGEAAETIGDVVEPAQAIRALTKVIEEDPSDVVRNEALEGLVEMTGGEGLETARKLAAESPDPDLRASAVEEIAPHLPPDEAIRWIESVIEKDRSSRVQREAVETLGDLGDPRAAALLAEVARHHANPEIRQEAVETLQNYPDEAMETFRKLIAEEESVDVVAEIIETALDLNSRDGLAFVREQARSHPDRNVRSLATEELEKR